MTHEDDSLIKELAISIVGSLAVFTAILLLIWGTLTGIRMHWESGCKADGHAVQVVGYGISKTYWCVDAKGNIVDVY
jgi:hypothetical protein